MGQQVSFLIAPNSIENSNSTSKNDTMENILFTDEFTYHISSFYVHILNANTLFASAFYVHRRKLNAPEHSNSVQMNIALYTINNLIYHLREINVSS